MRNESNKNRRENQNTNICVVIFSENLAFCEIMSKNMVEPEKPQMTIGQRVGCWII